MPARESIHLTTPSAADTERLARRLADVATAPLCILLSGEIGAGKSVFARAFIRARGVTEQDIPSPTFTLVQTYGTEQGEIWHADLYRLTHVEEVEELGLLDAFDTHICIVEWPDRLGREAPADALGVELSQTDDPERREIVITLPHSVAPALREAFTG